MTAHLKLKQIFKNDLDFAWRLLQAECQIHIKKNLSIQDITYASQLYMKAVQKLNTIQDQRQKYFSQKMQKLMAEPYVIRCFNQGNEPKKNDRQFKRKQIQQIVSHESEKANSQRLQHMLSQYGEKQKKIKSKIDKIIQQHEKSLEQRLKKRASFRPDRLSYIQNSPTLPNNKNEYEKTPWKSQQFFNPENSRTTVCSQVLQLNSP